MNPLEEWRVAQSWPNGAPALKPAPNLHPTLLQQVWATPYAGALVQGGIIDPTLGVTQLGGHLAGIAARATGYPELDPTHLVDSWVNNTNQNLDNALQATGTNPTAYEIGRYAGNAAAALATGPLGPELEAGLLAKGLARPIARVVTDNLENRALRKAAVYGAEKAVPGAAEGAVRSAILGPADTRQGGSYWASKASEVGIGAALGATADPLVEAWAKKAAAGIEKAAPWAGDMLHSLGAGERPGSASKSGPAPYFPFDHAPGNAAPPIGERVPGRAGVDGSTAEGAPMGDSVPGRAGVDSPEPAPTPMSDNTGTRGQTALAALEQAYGPLTAKSSMPPGLFGGWHYSNYPDYWNET